MRNHYRREPGLGFEIAKQYLEAGASLMICARNEDAAGQSAASLSSSSRGPDSRCLHCRPMSPNLRM
jgi:NAD(P)-dependent dehydrogenase (short-subunit alcohol dehydrogenase family)